MTRVQRPSADPTRDRILAAATELFSERSFDGATMREIAAVAGDHAHEIGRAHV